MINRILHSGIDKDLRHRKRYGMTMYSKRSLDHFSLLCYCVDQNHKNSSGCDHQRFIYCMRCVFLTMKFRNTLYFLPQFVGTYLRFFFFIVVKYSPTVGAIIGHKYNCIHKNTAFQLVHWKISKINRITRSVQRQWPLKYRWVVLD